MVSVFDTRRANLRALMQQWGGPTSLAARLGHSNGSFLAQLAGPAPRKDVSEKVARDIERKLDLPTGWMDHASPPRRHKSEPDTARLVELVALTHDLADAARVKLAKDKFTLVVELAYEHAALHGSIDQRHLARLIQLAR